jgi:uncharacterized repeat protein (TIGR04138 family)
VTGPRRADDRWADDRWADVRRRLRARGLRWTPQRGVLLDVLAGVDGHVTGAELAWACRDFARDQFGLLAESVLGHWGVTRTEDFGRIVFTLVDIGLLVTQPGDQVEDFEGVYDFAEAFGDVYRWSGVRGA